MSMIALRVSDGLKKRMAHVQINWSEYLRQSIEEALEADKKRQLLAVAHKLVPRHQRPRPGSAAALIRRLRDRA